MEKPPFNPNAPYVPVQSKPIFNPNAPFSQAQGGVSVDSVLPADTSLSGRAASFGKGILDDYVIPAGRVVDSYTAAPSRKAVSELISQDGIGNKIKGAVVGFKNQFGADPEKAPTHTELRQQVGVDLGDKMLADTDAAGFLGKTPAGFILGKTPLGFLAKKAAENISANDVADFAIGAGVDVTNLIPGVLIAKTVGRSGTGAARVGMSIAPKIARKTAQIADTAIGTKSVSNAVEKAAEIASRSKEILEANLSPKVAPDYLKSVETAKKFGMDVSKLPEEVEFGPRSIVTRGMRSLREGSTGEKGLDAYKAAQEDISDAALRHVEKISGGPALDEVSAGSVIQSGMKRHQQELFSTMDVTYANVAKKVPGLKVHPESFKPVEAKLRGLERTAKGLIRGNMSDIQVEEASALLKAVAGVRRSTNNYKQTVETLQRLGDLAFKKQPVLGRVSPDVEKMRELYFTISDALVDTIRRDGSGDVADKLLENNNKMSAFFKDKERLVQAFDGDISPERLFQSMVKNGDTKDLTALAGRLSPQELQSVKGAMINSMIRVNEEGIVSFARLAADLRSKKNQLSVLFSPAELRDLSEIVALGRKYGNPLISSSGSSAGMRLMSLITDTARGVTQEEGLEILKNKARKKGLIGGSSTPPPVSSAGAPSSSMGLLTSADQRPSIGSSFLRGKQEMRAKASQTLAPGSYNREEKNK